MSNNQVSFQLGSKEDLLQHQKVSEYYEIGCRKALTGNLYLWAVKIIFPLGFMKYKLFGSAKEQQSC